MKLDGKVVAVQGNVSDDSVKATIDEASMSKLFGFLQDPYKNSIGAVVREYVSNSFDSHAEAAFIKASTLTEIRLEYPIYEQVPDAEIMELKKHLEVFNNDAVYVALDKDETGNFWIAEDFGVGLSPQRVTDVFCSYLKSTKENTNNVIGAFGIGSKSGLSYADLFFIRTRYNGMEYSFMLRKGEEAPCLDKLGEEPTTKRNGTEIKIYIKSQMDVIRFRQECSKQLAYFDNVYFNQGVEIANDYTILQGENWIKSSNGNPFSGLHLCLGKVAYPIDWDQLNRERLTADLALKFEIGELDVIPTREDVKYNPKTKAAINAKIDALREEVSNKWENEKAYIITNIQEYYSKKGTYPSVQYKSSVDGGWSFSLDLRSVLGNQQFALWQFKPFADVGLTTVPSLDKLTAGFYISSQLTGAGLRKLDYEPNLINILEKKNYKFNYCTPYRIRDNHTPKKSKYIREELEGSNIPLVRKRKVSLRGYRKMLSLKWDEKHLWRDQIKVAQKIALQYMLSKTISYDNVVIDPEWLKSQRATRKQIDKRKFLMTKYSQYLNRWEKTRLMKGDVDSANGKLFVAGVESQKEELKIIGNFFHKMHPNVLVMDGERNTGYLHVGFVAPTNLKYLEDVPNLITVGNFHSSRPFKRAMTAYHVRTMPEYELALKVLDQYSPELWDHVYDKANTLMGEAYLYMKKNGIYSKKEDLKEGTIIQSGYEYVKELDAFDTDFMEKLDLINEYISNIPMLETTLDYYGKHTVSDKTKIDHEKVAIEIVKAIVMHNCYMPKKQRKRINAYYYALFNSNELSWMSKEDKQLIEYIQRPKFKHYER
jgi:hypothetical protein